jgi:hypothetical protein
VALMTMSRIVSCTLNPALTRVINQIGEPVELGG